MQIIKVRLCIVVSAVIDLKKLMANINPSSKRLQSLSWYNYVVYMRKLVIEINSLLNNQFLTIHRFLLLFCFAIGEGGLCTHIGKMMSKTANDSGWLQPEASYNWLLLRTTTGQKIPPQLWWWFKSYLQSVPSSCHDTHINITQ